VTAVSFSDDGRVANVACQDGKIWSWRVPKVVEDDEERVRLWTEVTSLNALTEAHYQPLTQEQLQERILQLKEHGNVPDE
jgi:hypothetical protein